MSLAFTSRCPVCDGDTAERGDLLCVNCWRRVPRPLVELYRLVWRLHKAELAATDGVRYFAELLVRAARGPAGPLAAVVPATVPPAKEPKRERKPTPDRPSAWEGPVLKALSATASKALTVNELAEKLGVHPQSVKDALYALADRGAVQRRPRVRPGAIGRKPNEYWLAA